MSAILARLIAKMTLTQILSASVLFPALIGSIYFRSLPGHGKMFVWFIYATLISEILSIILAKLFGNNMIVFYFYSSSIALTLGIAYSKILDRKLLIFYLVPATAIVESFIAGYTTFNSYSFTVLNVLLAGTVLMAFQKMILEDIAKETFYFNSVVLFAAMSNLFFYFTAAFLQHTDVDLMRTIFAIHNWVNMVTNLAFGYSLWILSRSYSSAR